MHAFLIETTNFEDEDLKLFDQKKIHWEKKIFVEIRKVEEVKDFKSLLRFPPKEQTLYVISGVDEASVEAQNSLLKLFEEPPSDTVLFLITVINSEKVIPTILSRIQIIKGNKLSSVADDSNFIFSEMNKVDQLQYISDIKERDEALRFLSNISSNIKESIEYRDRALMTTEKLERNANVALSLLNFLAT